MRLLVRQWTERFGADNEGIRAIIRNRADVWFPTRRFRIDILRALHAAEPTASGWVALALRRSEPEAGPLGLSFGNRHDQAVATLREALGPRTDAGVEVVLQRWLTELAP